MQVIDARNVNDAWDQARNLLNQTHVARPSRYGDVWEFPQPVTTLYRNPLERVLFNPLRNANPFFHLFESLYLLSGREDVAWLAQFNPRMKEFSDDGVRFHASYGHRLRFAFDLDGGAEDDYADQLLKVVRMLKKSPDERRAVLGIWNPIWDLERPEIKDIPCNDLIFLKIREGKLTMTVCCRSNDVVWGCYGSNIAQFSTLLEYLAAMIGVPVGAYYQVSDSWHAYTNKWSDAGGFDTTPTQDYYSEDTKCVPYPLVSCPETFDEEVKRWVETGGKGEYANHFFVFVANPLLQSWKAYKAGDLEEAKHLAKGMCFAKDWSRAAVEFLERIEEKRKIKNAVL